MTLQIEFGFLAKPIATQLRKQRIRIADATKIDHWQKDADAILRLAVRGLIPERARDNARKRLMRDIIKLRPPTTGAKRAH